MLNLAAAFSGIAERVGAVTGAPFYVGAIITNADTIYDDGGSIVVPGGVDRAACRVQIDAVSEAMRSSDGYADGDVRFIILSASLVGALDTDARVDVPNGPHAGQWLVSAIERDPAAIGYVGRGRRA